MAGGFSILRKLRLSIIPALNNDNTQILTRNSTTGEVEYRDVSTISPNVTGEDGVTVEDGSIIGLGDITPETVEASGWVTGSNLSGTNTGDNSPNTNSNNYTDEKAETSIVILSDLTVALNVVGLKAYYGLTGSGALASLPTISGNSGKSFIIANKSAGNISVYSNDSIAADISNKGILIASIVISSGKIIEMFNDGVSWIVTDLYDEDIVVLKRTSTTILFDKISYYGSPTTPLTTNLTLDFTNAVSGMIQDVFHQSATIPTIGTTNIIGEYQPGALNKISLEYYDNTHIYATIKAI